MSAVAQEKKEEVNKLVDSFDYIDDLELAELAEIFDSYIADASDPIGAAYVKIMFAFAELCRATIDNS